MPENNLKAYLFLLKNPSQSAMEAACRQARKLNLIVSGRHQNDAITVLANSTQAKQLKATSLFLYHSNKTISASVIKKLKEAQAGIATFWNLRFSEAYQKRIEASQNEEKVYWGTYPKQTPAFYCKHNPKKIIEGIKAIIKKKKLKTPRGPVDKILSKYEIDVKKEGRGPIVMLIRNWLKKKYHVQLTGGIYNMPYASLKYILRPDLAEVANLVVSNFEVGTPCRTLHGVISVGVIFVDSTDTNINLSLGDQNTILNDIVTGNNWVASEHPSGNLAFSYNIQRVTISVANRPNSEDGPDPDFDQYWRNPAMDQVRFNGTRFPANLAGIEAYKNAMRAADGSDDAVVYFITRYGSSNYAYSSGESHMVITQSEADWGREIRDQSYVAAHELLHQFGALDEYSFVGPEILAVAFNPLPATNTRANVQAAYNATPCNNCEDFGGCDHIPNGNCGSCESRQRRCIMVSRRFDMCQYTRGQIGWADIFVEITTANDYWAGTSDNVFLDIGERGYLLERNYSDERERGTKDAYALFDGGNITRDQIKRLLIRKEVDSSSGGWRIQQIRVFHDCEEIANETPLVWLANNNLHYLMPSYDSDPLYVNSLSLRVITGNANGAGLNGTVVLNIGSFIWLIDSEENDFQRNSSREYSLDPFINFMVADINTLTITKRSGGQWLLGGLELIVNGQIIYSNLNINRWFETNPSEFTDTF